MYGAAAMPAVGGQFPNKGSPIIHVIAVFPWFHACYHHDSHYDDDYCGCLFIDVLVVFVTFCFD